MSFASRAFIVALAVSAAAAAATLTVPAASGAAVIDGRLDDPLWREARALPLNASGFGSPFAAGGEIRIAVHAGYLYVNANLPEPDRVTAISQGQNPAWWREDLVVWRISSLVGGRGRSLTLSINPPGAYSVEPAASLKGVAAASKMTAGAWTAEAAIPLDAIGDLGFLSVERIRPPRPDAPELRWQWPAIYERADFTLPDGARAARAAPPSRPSETPAPKSSRRGSAGSAIPGAVWSDEQRRQLRTATMVETSHRKRMAAAAAAERREWESVRTRAEWERFRDKRVNALRTSLGAFPAKTPLRAVVTRRADYGDGFAIENVVYESRPQLLVTANLYLPSKVSGRIPAIVVIHSHHAPKTQSELQDMGMTWARNGTAVLVMDQLGAGERLQSQPWPRESYHSRYALGMQLYLAGESLMKWMAWDIMRGIDLLLERPYIDPRRIILLGAVAGGGDPAAVTAALDSRVAAVIPFNFGEAGPEEHYTLGPRPYDAKTADPGWGEWESSRNLRRTAVDQFFPCLICASVAPRPFLYSFEIGWPKTVEQEPAWARYQRVYEFYGRRDRLAEVHGFGPFPGPGECTNVGTFLRKQIYPVLKRWLDVPVPPQEYHNPRPEADLMCLTTAVAGERKPKPTAVLAAQMARERLAAARSNPSRLRASLQAKLGDIEPAANVAARVAWSRSAGKFQEQAVTLETEPGITVPVVLLRPASAGMARLPVVIALAQQGKQRFLAERGKELTQLLAGGVAVCLPDVRGVGETAGSGSRGPEAMSAAATELMLGSTMLGARLKDARTVVRYLARRSDVDSKRMVLWGDSFAPANPRDLLLDKSPGQTFGGQLQSQAEPLGALLALLTALYEPEVKAAAARGGLVSFLSVLEDRFTYVPLDVVAPGLLEAGDVPDVVAALAPRPVLLQGSVDGRNRPSGKDSTERLADWIAARAKN